MAGPWGNCNFEQLVAMQKRLEYLEKQKVNRFYADCARELAARLLALVIPKTPVGVKPVSLTSAPQASKVVGASGKVRTLASREQQILKQHWSGYVGGTLRRGWTAKTEEEAKNGKAKSAKQYVQEIPIRKAGRNYIITINNPVSYASYVEDGHRQTPGRYVPQIGKSLKRDFVPGKHMLMVSLFELETIAPPILEKKLIKLLKGALDG